MVKRPPYPGGSRKLVLAFDVGTTCSGISYCVLDPGEVPEIKGVLKFPYQEAVSGNFKVPSVIWYSADGDVMEIGAGAVRDGVEQEAEDGQWSKVEWFKLHLRPKALGKDEVGEFINQIPRLPAGKTITDVFADYFRYLFQSARTYIEERHPSRELFWNSIESNIEFVLSHPNGWEGAQQSQMRRAAVLAGLVPNEQAGAERIRFVTEGEASLHVCVGEGLMTEAMENGGRVMVVDAGGGTIDISSYGNSGPDSKSFEEVAAPQCKLRGSIFVTLRARAYLEDYLRDSTFARDVPDMVKIFDKTTKLRFRQSDEPSFIKFGRIADTDIKHNIRSGQIKLDGTVVADFFQSSIDCITKVILEHHRDHNINTVFLVGGFAASDWLFHRVQAAVKNLGIKVCRPDNHVNKAVADGAVSFFIDHFVSTRVSKFQYGTRVHIPYQRRKASHRARINTQFEDLSGEMCLPGAFDVILPKDTRVTEKQEFQEGYKFQGRSKDSSEHIQTGVLCYRGPRDTIEWIDEDEGNFEVMCSIEADTSLASRALVPRRTSDGRTFYELDFKIILLFGLTEFKAQLCWEEHGKEKRGPARVIYTTE
ncbi:hypothetical protein BDN72DRAFT_802291 [Pluteus cervinus]|uniref:Uncharacterized protein n=1 Tax=Pluteus cervinus TaxID=181527 RepID=A0ACD3AF41_9AGAR|nr:hypothetical protein BDN72DRAFT_802291 [Pluteus cervinus]